MYIKYTHLSSIDFFSFCFVQDEFVNSNTWMNVNYETLHPK